MACSGCGQTRRAFVNAARAGNLRGMGAAVATAVSINVDKMRGVDVQRKYGGKAPVVTATPYKRPDRTT